MSRRRASGFTLFEVLVALGVFAIAVTGLAIAIESGIRAALDTRTAAAAREVLESRLAVCLADPPLGNERVIEARTNHGIRIREVMVPEKLTTTNKTILPGMWRLTITAEWGPRQKETADILLYRP